MEGLQIGMYQIERKLGEGGMGVVWIGVDVRLGRRAAIKQLLPEMSHNRDIVERFFNEAKAAASINHPGIVEVYDVGWHVDGSAFFAMKLLEGDSLARRLRNTGPMPVMVAATVARQVASALQAAHARGIVHRDLKPDNIVLVADDEVSIGERATVLDFGIAKLFGDRPQSQKTRTGSVVGTPSYMSPEQCRGAGEVDHRTDVYALGCILFEMLTGRPPFVGEGAGEVLGMHQFVESPTVRSLRGDVPPAFEAVVMRALSKRTDQRHQSMAELTAALQPFATARASLEQPSQPPPSYPPSYPPDRSAIGEASTLSGGRGQFATSPPAPAAKSRKTALIVGGAVAVVAAVVIAVVAASGGGSPGAGVAAAPSAELDAAAAITAPEVAPALDAASPAEPPSQLAPLLASARAALADRNWPEAVSAANAVLAQAPDHADARAIVEQAKNEQSNELRHDDFVKAVNNQDYAGAVAAFEKLDASSVYKNAARDHLDKLHDDFLKDKTKQARALAKAGKCDQLKKLATDAGKVFADAREVIQREPCEAHREQLTAPGDPLGNRGGAVATGKSALELIAEAETAGKMSAWASSLRLAEQAYGAPDADGASRARAAFLITLGACNLKNQPLAKRYYPRMTPSAQTMTRQRCLSNGVEVQ